MRHMVYAGMLYAKYIEQTPSCHPYSSTLQKAPTPKCICFYNGPQDKEDRTVLHLRDAFSEDGDIDVRVTMININYGKNEDLMDSCAPLREYAWFVAKVREKQKDLDSLEAAIDAAASLYVSDSSSGPISAFSSASSRASRPSPVSEE